MKFLVFTRRRQERVRVKIGELEVWVEVADIRGKQVRLAFKLPDGGESIEVDREEVAIKKIQGGASCTATMEDHGHGNSESDDGSEPNACGGGAGG